MQSLLFNNSEWVWRQLKRRIDLDSKWRVFSALTLLAVSSVLSVWMTWNYATEPSGYAAGYAYGGALLFTCIFLFQGLVLLVWRKTRWFGVALLSTGVWLFVSFLVTAGLVYRLEMVPWKGEKMVSLLPEKGAGYYIYFRPGTPQEAVEDFTRDVIHEPPSARGQDLRPGIRSYARLISRDGRDVAAIGLQPTLTFAQRHDLRSRLETCPIVAEVTDGPWPKP